MNQMISDINELERYLGFSTDRLEITLDSKWPQNEIFSYDLLQRFYNKEEELKAAINRATKILKILVESNNKDNKKVSNHFSLLGNMYYLLGDFNKSIGCFMQALSYYKNDLTCWVELMFSLRSNRNFEVFEDLIFNIEKIYVLWKEDGAKELTKEKIYELINKAKN